MLDCQELKERIEKMDKYHQIEILRIFNESGDTNMNENKNGIFINLTEQSVKTLEQVSTYVKYVDEQIEQLDKIESEKSQIEETFFKQDKDKQHIK
jgi:hypothetical protein